MESTIKWLSGKKTYLLAGLAGCVTIAYVSGYIDREVWETLMGVLGFGSMITLRAGVAKAQRGRK